MMYIGIDPDLIKSGVATWTSRPESLDVTTLDFFDLMEYVKDRRRQDARMVVFLEAGWNNKKSNFHFKNKDGSDKTQNVRERAAKNVGENHGAGKLIEQFLKKEGITYYLVTPLTKKWDAETFSKVTGIKKRTNSEMRDAARLVYGR